MSFTDPVHILWTGGWDSTFRLLNLLIIKQRVVQPYYLIDCKRPSFAVEIQTIRKLKSVLMERVPDCKSRLLPTVFKEVNDLRPNSTITDQMRSLKSRGHLGRQYEWLARFAEDINRSDLELSIHRDDKAHKFLEHFVIQEFDETDSYYRLQNDPPQSDLQLFKYFRFPLFNLTKLDMQQFASAHQLDYYMERTWFCYSPLKNGSACGTCNPCLWTREEGLGRRIGSEGDMRYYVRRQALVKDPVNVIQAIAKNPVKALRAAVSKLNS